MDQAALEDNYRLLIGRVRAVSPRTRAMAVVKADAYGHGILPVVQTLARAGCRSFAVSCIEEGLILRGVLDELPCPDADVLILGYVRPEEAPLLSEHRLTAALVSAEHARALDGAARARGVTVTAHAALDTGMCRIGLPARTDGEAADTAEILSGFPFAEAPGARRSGGGILIDGAFTHFAQSDGDYEEEMSDAGFTSLQFERYERVIRALAGRGIRPRVQHVCNSAAAARFPVRHPSRCLDEVRLGKALYGYCVPFPEGDGAPGQLRTVLRLETEVVRLQTLLPRESVGYRRTYQAGTPRLIATLPIGYADGLVRALSGAPVTVRTRQGDFRAPIVGLICMDQCMLDVTGIPAAVGDTVTLFGQSAADLEALAAHAGTIVYELLCLLTARVPRLYV